MCHGFSRLIRLALLSRQRDSLASASQSRDAVCYAACPHAAAPLLARATRLPTNTEPRVVHVCWVDSSPLRPVHAPQRPAGCWELRAPTRTTAHASAFRLPLAPVTSPAPQPPSTPASAMHTTSESRRLGWLLIYLFLSRRRFYRCSRCMWALHRGRRDGSTYDRAVPERWLQPSTDTNRENRASGCAAP